MDSLRILHITETGIGGVGRHLELVLPALRKQGIVSGLIVSECRADSAFLDKLDVICGAPTRHWTVPISTVPAVSDILVLRRISRIVDEWRPDVVHAHSTKAGLLGRLACRRMGVPLVYTPHAFFFQRFHAALTRSTVALFDRLLCRIRPAYSIFVSRSEQAVAEEYGLVGDGSFCICENGLPDDFRRKMLSRESARDDLGIGHDTIAVGVPGRIAHQKGQDWFLRAIPRTKVDDRVHFFMAGTGPGQVSLQRFCNYKGLTHRVTWLGNVPELQRKLAAFDLVVLPSRYEGLSYLLLETLASGIPLIVSDIPAHFPRQTLRSRIRSVKPEDCEGLARLLTASCQQSTELRKNFAEWAPEFVATEFSLSAQAECLAAAYRRSSGSSVPNPP